MMTIFKKLFTAKSEDTLSDKQKNKNIIPGLTEIGNVNLICPSCENKLDEKPSRKKKCPHCGNYIFVRTRPLDREKVLITEEQIDQIELQWDMYNEHKEREIYEKDPEYIQMRDELRARFNKEPLVNDVCWGLANRKSIEHCQENDWGLYCNAKSEMAKIFEKENRIKESLRIYLEFFFLACSFNVHYI